MYALELTCAHSDAFSPSRTITEHLLCTRHSFNIEMKAGKDAKSSLLRAYVLVEGKIISKVITAGDGVLKQGESTAP